MPDRVPKAAAITDAATASGLFRREALEHAGMRTYGQIILRNPVSGWLLVLAYGAIVGGIATFLVCASYTRSVTVSGVLAPRGGLLRVIAPAGGVVAAEPVAAGTSVSPGDVLLTLRAQRASADTTSTDEALGALLHARRDSLSSDLQQLSGQFALRAGAVRRRLRELQAEDLQLQAQIGLQQRRVALAQQAQQRYGELQARGFVATAQWQDRQSELLDQQQRLAELGRAQSLATRDATAARAELQELGLQKLREQEAAQRNLALLDQELAENAVQRERVLRAATAGTVAAINVERGQTILAGQLLALIVPAGARLEAELYAPSQAAARLRTGMVVRLRYQGFPYQKYGQFRGQIREVAGTAVPAAALGDAALLPAAPSAEPLYRVRVQLQVQSVAVNGERIGLKPGAALEASVPLDRRRIILWLLDPLFGLARGA